MAAALGLVLSVFALPGATDPVALLAIAGLALLVTVAVSTLAGSAPASASVGRSERDVVLQPRPLLLPSSRPSSRPRPRAPGRGMLAG